MNPTAQSSGPRPKVGVSYAWREEEGDGINQGKVEELCTYLRGRGIEVIRDKTHAENGKSLVDFMKEIADQDHLCVFLSEAYLRSEWCMRELLTAWQRSCSDPDRFRKRVKVWLMPGMSLEDRARWTGHWKTEADRKKKELDGLAPQTVTGEYDLLRLFENIAADVNKILLHVRDHLAPRTFDEFVDWVTDTFLETSAAPTVPTVQPRPTPNPPVPNPPSPSPNPVPSMPLPDYRAKVIEAIEAKLSSTALAGLAKKLATIPDLGALKSGQFVVSRKLRIGPEPVYDVVLGIEKLVNNKDVSKASERKELANVVGGVVVLGMSPVWLADQFRGHQSGHPIPVPSDQGRLSVEDGTSADLLSLVSCAFFSREFNLDGTLKKLFSKDDLATKDAGPGETLRGVGADDIEFELKCHLVEQLHPKRGKRSRPSGGLDPDYRKWIADRFGELIGYVNRDHDKGNSQYLSHKDYAAHIPTIRRMGLDKLLFLIPVDGNFEDAFRKHVEVLKTAWDLHERLLK